MLLAAFDTITQCIREHLRRKHAAGIILNTLVKQKLIILL